jgi:hypothetical protein
MKKQNKNKIRILSGLTVLAIVFALNLYYAQNGYGIKTNSLNPEIRGQVNDADIKLTE